jgi:hypothetical protein
VTVGGVIARVTKALSASGIPYMLTGSLASALHGTARATQDVDLVIAPDREQLRSFIDHLPKDRYYADLGTAMEALRLERMFNLIDLEAGWKVDLIIRKSRPFSKAEFDRRRETEVLGARTFVASAEDVVISKLEWAKLGQSTRQIEDVAGILRMRPDLDRQYLERWLRELHLEAQWRAACEAAGVTP